MTAPKGHNSGVVVADRLQSFVNRIEKLEEERVAIGGDIKDVYSEAKGVGYDVKTMRKVVGLRKMDAADRAEQEALLHTYMHALGMVDRIDARLEAGESQREIAAAEKVSKSTVQRRGPKTTAQNASTKMDRPAKPEGGDDGEDPVPATGEIKEEGSLSGRDAGGVPSGRVSSSDEQEAGAAREQSDDCGIESRLLSEGDGGGAAGMGEGDAHVHERGGPDDAAAGGDIPALSAPLGTEPAADPAAEAPQAAVLLHAPVEPSQDPIWDELATVKRDLEAAYLLKAKREQVPA